MNLASCSCLPEFLPSTPRHQPNKTRLVESTAEIAFLLNGTDYFGSKSFSSSEASSGTLTHIQNTCVTRIKNRRVAIPGTKIFKAKALTGYCGLNVEYLHRLTHLNTLFPVGRLFLEHCSTFRRRNLAEGNRT